MVITYALSLVLAYYVVSAILYCVTMRRHEVCFAVSGHHDLVIKRHCIMHTGGGASVCTQNLRQCVLEQII